MEEKILQTKKNGMLVLMLTLLGFVLDVIAFVFAIRWLERDWMLAGVPMLILAILYLIVGILLLCGLKVLKPQEALVLTLLGDYIGTLKGEGFYWINPFCTPVNPAAGTRRARAEMWAARQVQQQPSRHRTPRPLPRQPSKKISLKRMTLNNARQKINDCLGNPVEIGIAVIWRVTDTAKAVFNVDNYKEYLSLV